MAHDITTPNTSDTAQRSGQVGTAVGAAGGITAGAVAGAVVGGPAGAVIGAAVGAVVGSVGTRLLSDNFDTTPVDSHWRGRFEKEPYYESGHAWDDYAPAYRLGAAARSRYPEVSFEEAETAMETEYCDARGGSKLSWERARLAAEASFHTEYF